MDFPCQIRSGSISIARPSAWKSSMGQGAGSSMVDNNIVSKARTTILAFFTPGPAFCVPSTFFFLVDLQNQGHVNFAYMPILGP